MEEANHEALYEQVCHKSENLPLKIYQTRGVHLHWHEEYEFIIVKKGRVQCVVNGKTIELTKHTALLLHSGDLHSIHHNADASIIAIVASPLFWADEMFASLFGDNITFQSVFNDNDSVDRAVVDLIKQIIGIYNSKDFGYGFLIKAKFLELFSLLITYGRFSCSPKSIRRIPGEVKKLMNYVHEHYTEKISLQTLSSISFYSQTYIIKLFKQYTSFTPAEYITQYRLEIAQRRLCESSESNVTIALSCGFNSETYFIRAFKKRYGITPHVYRKENSKK